MEFSEEQPQSQAPEQAATPSGLPRIQIIGVGGAGMAMLQTLDATEVPGARLSVVLTDAKQHAHCGFSEKLLLENRRLRGLGVGSDPERARAVAEENASALQNLVSNSDVVVLVAGFGGGSGTGITPVLAKAAKDAGAMTFVFATLPFACELRRSQLAVQGISDTREIADGVICLSNEKVLSLIDETTSCEDAFALTRRLVAQGLRGFFQWLVYRGPMEVPFDEVVRLLQNQHSESVFATAEATGSGRARAIVDELLASPLLDEGHLLGEAQAVLISVLAGADVPMMEVQTIIKEINAHCQTTEIIAGAAVVAGMQGRIAVTVLVSRPEPVHSQRAAPAVERTSSPQVPISRAALGGLGETRRTQFDVSSAPGEGTPEMSSRSRKLAGKLRQAQLALPLVSRGQRFENSEPTMHKGEDLDIPTYIRRGIPLN